jgi:hypothetical protein
MSEQWSSYDDQQQRVEDWRTFLKEGSFLQRMRKKDTPDIEDMSDPEVLEIYATATDEKIVRQAARQYLSRAIDATDSNARIQTLNDIVTSKEAPPPPKETAPTSSPVPTALGEPVTAVPERPSPDSVRLPPIPSTPAEPAEDPAEEEAEEVGSELYGGFPSESKAPMRPLIKEAQLKRWQQLSGIKPRVL